MRYKWLKCATFQNHQNKHKNREKSQYSSGFNGISEQIRIPPPLFYKPSIYAGSEKSCQLSCQHKNTPCRWRSDRGLLHSLNWNSTQSERGKTCGDEERGYANKVFQVTGPTIPSTLIRWSFWKALTFFSVSLPNIPSISKGYPRKVRAFCSRRT